MLRSQLQKQADRERERRDLSGRLATLNDPYSVASEAYRVLRTNLLFARVDKPPKLIVMTSTGPVAGKSTTCCNLGVVLAQAGKRTLLVDCDFRKPVMHQIFGLRNVRGMVDVLIGDDTLENVMQEPLERLKVLTVGYIPPNPAELLSSTRFTQFLDGVREQFDYILLDVPPVEVVADAAIVASQADGVLLVLDAQETRREAVRRSMHNLHSVGARVIGTVMNNVDARSDGYYGGYVYKQ